MKKAMTPNPWPPDRVKALRKRYGESQADFAKRFRVSIQAIQTWEQGKGEPSGPAQVLLDQFEAAAPAEMAESV